MKKIIFIMFPLLLFSQTTPPVMLWEQIYDVTTISSNGVSFFNSIIQSHSSNEYVLTSIYNTENTLFKIDTDGNLIWQQSAPVNISNIGGKGVAILSDNLYYTITENCPSSVQNSIQQFDNDGNILGNWCLTNSENNSNFNYIISTNDGGLLISTTTTLKKFNSSKILEWSANHTPNSVISNIIETSDGHFVAVGSIDPTVLGNTNGGCYMVKYDSLGNMLWQRNFGDSIDVIESAYTVAELSNGNFITACFSNNLIDDEFFEGTWMYTVNPSGDVLGHKILPPYGAQSYSNIIIEGRGYVVAIITASNGETSKFRLIKVNETNEIEWDVSFSDGWIYDLTKTSEGDYIAVGTDYNASVSGSGNLKAMKIGWEPLSTPSFENSVSLYPNPAQDYIIVKNNFSENQTVVIYNVAGQTIMTQEINQNENSLDVAKLASGIYFVHVSESNTTLKWVKD